MRLYLLRHGDAEDVAPSGRDFDRRLTPEGIERMRAEAEGMRVLSLTFDAIFTSPLDRAKETASLVAKTLGLPAPVVEARVGGGFRIGVIQEIVAEQERGQKFLFVGHQPDMSLTLQQLCGGGAEMKRGSLACIECAHPEPGLGVLLWLLTPRQLITLSKTR